jgi:hypothetical protein
VKPFGWGAFSGALLCSIMFFSRIGGWGLHQSRVLCLGWNQWLKGGGGIKHGNMERTVVPNVLLWNVGLQWMLIVLLNAFSCKESTTREYCILIRVLSYTNPHLQQRRNRCELATTHFVWWCSSHAASEQTIDNIPMEQVEILLFISRPHLRWLVTHRCDLWIIPT